MNAIRPRLLLATFAVISIGLAGVVFASSQPTPIAQKQQSGTTAANRMVPKRVPAFPPGVKERGDRLWGIASPAVRAWANQNAPLIAHGTTDPEAEAYAAVRARFTNLRPSGQDTVAFLLLYRSAETLKNEVKSKLDSLSEMGETESLRLQMMMDRLSKFMTALSNIMKKISDTADGIVSNLK